MRRHPTGVRFGSTEWSSSQMQCYTERWKNDVTRAELYWAVEEWCNNNRGSVNAGSVKPYERKPRVDRAKPCWNMVFFCFIKLTNSKMREDLPDHFPRKNIFICCFTFLWRFLRYRYWKGCAVQFKKFKKWAESLFSTLEPRRHLSFLLFPNSHQILCKNFPNIKF